MKTMVKNFFLFSSVATLALLASCDVADEAQNDQTFNYSAENTSRAAITDNVVDGTFNIMDNAYAESQDASRNPVSLFPACTTITVTINGDSGTILLDFGTSCTLANGSVVSGKILLEYGPFTGGTRTITYSFEDYFYNNNGVMGGGTIFHQIANGNGLPQSTVNETITVSFPNTDVTATRTGTHTTVWVEGVGSGTWLDNVYHITGNWNTIFTNGFQRSGEVTQTLVKKLICPVFVSGKLEIVQDGFTGVIDFGNGECDNLATLTINGQVYPLIFN